MVSVIVECLLSSGCCRVGSVEWGKILNFELTYRFFLKNSVTSFRHSSARIPFVT